MTRMTRLREASDECMAGRPILRRTCAQPVKIRVIPENEIPPAMRVDVYSSFGKRRQPAARNCLTFSSRSSSVTLNFMARHFLQKNSVEPRFISFLVSPTSTVLSSFPQFLQKLITAERPLLLKVCTHEVRCGCNRCNCESRILRRSINPAHKV